MQRRLVQLVVLCCVLVIHVGARSTDALGTQEPAEAKKVYVRVHLNKTMAPTLHWHTLQASVASYLSLPNGSLVHSLHYDNLSDRPTAAFHIAAPRSSKMDGRMYMERLATASATDLAKLNITSVELFGMATPAPPKDDDEHDTKVAMIVILTGLVVCVVVLFGTLAVRQLRKPVARRTRADTMLDYDTYLVSANDEELLGVDTTHSVAGY